jgi:acyl-CoA synthetase (AMP-forming)/AMP-acid ligase II
MTADVVDAGDGLPLTVPALLRARADGRGEHPFLIGDDGTLTFAAAERQSAALARGLLSCGLGKGDHVALLFPNNAEFVVSWLAVARIGAVALPMSTFSTAEELRVMLKNADVSAILSAGSYRSHDYLRTLEGAIPGLDLQERPPIRSLELPILSRVLFSGSHERIDPAWLAERAIEAGQAVATERLEAVESIVRPADRLVVIHTSGSTSQPKGVVHLHGRLIRHSNNLNEIRRFTAEEVYFSNSPFFWIGGFAYVLLATLVAGATMVCSTAADPAAVLDLLERTKPTMVSGFAASVANLPKDPSFSGRDLSSIRRGNLYPILPPAIQPADPGLRHQMLGMSEAGSVCLLSEDESDQPESRRGSFGRPAPGFEAKTVDVESGRTCGVGETGELWLRSPFMMDGYYGRDRSETFETDGWFRTGDLFAVDSDGFYYFKGRSGEMIKTAGANVAPREVEAAILELTGLVAHVVGVDDDFRGQVVGAVVRVPPDQPEPDLEELRENLRARLSVYKIPQRLVALPEREIPMMTSGKLDLRALKVMLRDV